MVGAAMVISALGLRSAPAFARGGDLDTSFGDGGAVFDLVAPTAQARATLVQPDGKVVAAGDASNGSNQDFTVVRYSTAGSRDGGFGSAGVVLTPIGTGDDVARAVVSQADGKLIAGGQTAGATGLDFAVVRYLANGDLDASFGSGGIATLDFDGGDDAVNALVLQADGKLVAVGMATVGGQQVFALARYTAAGVLDTSFGGAGTVTTAFGAGAAAANAAVLQADEKVVVAGSAPTGTPGDFEFALARYNVDGSLDASFGTGGTVTTRFGSKRDAANALALQADGKLVAAGVAGGNTFAFARYNADGTPDTSFKGTGKVTYSLAGQATGLTLQPDGKLLAAGVSALSGVESFAVVRLRTDGNLDKPTFGKVGYVVTGYPLGVGIDIAAAALALQSDGAFVTAGMADDGTDTFFYLIRYLGDPPYTPPDTNSLKCWTKVGATLDKLRQCVITCQIKAVANSLTFDQLACESACRTSFDTAAAKLIAKGICPACLDTAGQSRLVDKATAYVNSRADPTYCEGTEPLAHPFFNEFPVPTAGSGLSAITLGPDDNFWFTEQTAGKIGRITPDGVVTEFPLPASTSAPSGIIVGPAEDLWFTEQTANKIGRITTDGTITEYTVPVPTTGPTSIVTGSDGNLWFTGQSSNRIGRLNVAFLDASPNFLFSSFPLASGSGPYGIAAGSDGRLWFTEKAGGKIGRMAVTGTVTEFPIPTVASAPDTIVNGPDGNLWFTEFAGNMIGRITPDGSVTEFAVPNAGGPRGITVGADGNLWFVEFTAGLVGRLTPGGVLTEYLLPDLNSQPVAITAALDGSLWLTQSATDRIGRIFLVGGGFVPPDAQTFSCEAVVAKNLGTLAKCLSKCQDKAVKANFKGKAFDRVACETGDPLKSCAAKFNAATNKLLLVGGCPACMGATTQAGLRDHFTQHMTDMQTDLFCSDVPS
jgi:uncharacterized delta-60 repeat protein